MGRTPHCSKDGLNRGAWTAQEDKMLTDYISTHGEGKWSNVARITGLKRCGKSCRLRWLNYLRPDIKRGNISHDEEELIVRLHKLLGNRWSLIAGRLPGRTDNEIKNYWNSNLAKKEQDFLLVLPKLNRTYLPIRCYNHSPPLPGTEPPPLPPPHNNNNNVRTFKTGSGTEPPPALPSAEENLAPDFLIDINMEEFCQILDPAASTKTSTDNNVTEGDGDVTTKDSKSEEVAEFPAVIFDEKYWDGNNECVQSDQLGGSEFMSLVSFLDSGVDW